ncbi:hypothetical protein SNOG_01232 [Parastagonospora nodorum SN15]|uniref:Uncharacterized protein n=1 Tax=Phaeosphaeria nodorum (strain SN15 / ATCC MYA-4574 / FGSC 10173) TaxID=321614 RepID=Q0V432_PHANO|nr:hypothetical protein SNOG_01232 [Parastagonospora nodorum SN15]EAT90881.2 hypothetical protein SNOG_01232 [Parastagonospora nodorum SN15]
MCVILPVSHIPCTHTVAIWQHCIDATRSGRNGVKPCWNVKQHEKSVITRRLCEDCSGQRFFARRGGVAERGNGSPTPSPAANDSADDSGYHSDVIHEEDEASDRDECPLSPKALAPRTKPNKQRKRTSSNHHSLTRKPSWKPNLKRELDFELAQAEKELDALTPFITHRGHEAQTKYLRTQRLVAITPFSTHGASGCDTAA